MDSNSNVAQKTTTETKTEHFNLGDLDPEPTNRFTTRPPLPAWQHPRKPTINNTRPTKRALVFGLALCFGESINLT
jgi:hypothetical protein